MILSGWGRGFIILPSFLELNRAEMIFLVWEGGRNFVDCFSMFDVEMNLPLIDLLTQRSYVHFTSLTANTNWRQQFHKLNANSQYCTIFSLIKLKGKYMSDMIWHFKNDCIYMVCVLSRKDPRTLNIRDVMI